MHFDILWVYFDSNTKYKMRNYKVSIRSLKSLALLFICSVLLAGFASCSCKQKDDMDRIKAFKPEDKYFKSSLVSLHFIMETSPVDEVDSAFRQLIDIYGLPVDASSVRDGVYSGESPYDAFDYKHVVKIRVVNGKFVEVAYNEVKKDGHGKREDVEYCEEMSVTGTTPAIAYPVMEEQLLSTQNLTEVDGVTGATYSRYRFRYALTVALMKALL